MRRPFSRSSRHLCASVRSLRSAGRQGWLAAMFRRPLAKYKNTSGPAPHRRRPGRPRTSGGSVCLVLVPGLTFLRLRKKTLRLRKRTLPLRPRPHRDAKHSRPHARPGLRPALRPLHSPPLTPAWRRIAAKGRPLAVSATAARCRLPLPLQVRTATPHTLPLRFSPRRRDARRTGTETPPASAPAKGR